jgi:predicted ribonuclease YlaK
VVADTSFCIQHPQEIDDLDLGEHLGIRDQPIHLLVPILVVDELDSLKQAKDGNVRGRARRTLAILDRVLSDPTAWGVLRREDFSPLQVGGIPSGEMTVELVLDPPGHVRLPINDDELVDRTVAFQALAAQKITMLTYDTGQSTRARAAGPRAVKIAQPPERDQAERDGARRTASRPTG